MTRVNKPKVIDGYSSIQALRQGGHLSQEAKTRPSSTKLPEPPPKKKDGSIEKPAGRFGSTIIPDKYEIVCYQCGYSFLLTGQLRKTFCPKCREELKIKDYIIDAEWSGTIKTIGTVDIKSGGSLKNANITAGRLIIDGDAGVNSVINASRILELGPNAKFDMSNISMTDLLIREGSKASIQQEISCRNLVVEGCLNIKTVNCEHAVLKKNGYLDGKLTAGSLTVEEGCGMNAELHIERKILK